MVKKDLVVLKCLLAIALNKRLKKKVKNIDASDKMVIKILIHLVGYDLIVY